MPIHPNTRRCIHLKTDGVQCGAPALTGKPKCHFHIQIYRRPKEFILPPLEDANAIQVGVMEVMRALVEDRMERSKAGTLLYALQIAQSNLSNISLVGKPEPAAGDYDESLEQILMREIAIVQQEELQQEQERTQRMKDGQDDSQPGGEASSEMFAAPEIK